MLLENYTIETFIANYIKDREVFGEDTKYIYEEIFSDIIEEKVDLTNFDNNLDDALVNFKYNLLEDIENCEALTEEEKEEGIMTISEAGALDAAKWISQVTGPSKAAALGASAGNAIFRAGKAAIAKPFAAAPNVAAWASQVGPKGIENLTMNLTKQGGFTGFFGKLKNKIAGFFGGLKGKSFSEILQSGMTWLQNPANLAKALGSVGGVVLVGMILRALKKRKRIKEYKKMAALTQSGLMKECFEEEFDFNGNIKPFAKAKNKVMAECKVNRALHNALFGEEDTIITKKNYFDY